MNVGRTPITPLPFPAISETDLADRIKAIYRPAMVFAELKPQIDQLPHSERLRAMAYLKHLLRAENPEYRHELARRHTDIEAGRKVRWEDLKRQLSLP